MTTVNTKSPSKATDQKKEATSVVIETLGATTSETKEGLRKINHYLLQQEIGHGTFGTVHLGIHTVTNKKYAIKEFSKLRLKRKKQLAMLRQHHRGKVLGEQLGSNNPLDLVRSEVAILKKLNHRNVIQLYEILDDPTHDSLYMVMEMAHKGVIMHINLNQSATPYTEKISRFYFRQMILGIEYLHYNDIVHRDIKPDNLLLADNNVLKIVDFGVSEMFVKGDDALQSTAGSPAFMPPELCTAKRNPVVSGKAADIWSMGVTLYCLVHGHVPFANDNILDLYKMIECDPVKYNKNLSPTLIDLLQRLLEKDPSKRILMQELRNHPWVTHDGQEPMISQEENCHSVLSEITDEDIQSAITSVSHIFTVIQAVAKFKRHSKPFSSTMTKENEDEEEEVGGKRRSKDSSTYFLPEDENLHKIYVYESQQEIQPILIDESSKRLKPSSLLEHDISSTFSSTMSSNSSVFNTTQHH